MGWPVTRFEKAIEEWKKKTSDQKVIDTACSYFASVLDWSLYGTAASVILLDVVRAVEAYERTIADLKRQNNKLRRTGRCPR